MPLFVFVIGTIDYDLIMNMHVLLGSGKECILFFYFSNSLKAAVTSSALCSFLASSKNLATSGGT